MNDKDSISNYSMPPEMRKFFCDLEQPDQDKIYRDWLRRRATCLFRRDRKTSKKNIKPRIQKSVSRSDYFSRLDKAVKLALKNGDFYTGEQINWNGLKSIPAGKIVPGDLPEFDHICGNYRNLGKAPLLVVCRREINNKKGEKPINKLLRENANTKDKEIAEKIDLLKRSGISTTQDAIKLYWIKISEI